MKDYSYFGFFSNFSNPTKMKIILSLIDAPLTVNGIVRKVNLEQSNVSHTLSNLKHCHIVTVAKKGRENVYSLNRETVLPILKLVDKHVTKNCRFCK